MPLIEIDTRHAAGASGPPTHLPSQSNFTATCTVQYCMLATRTCRALPFLAARSSRCRPFQSTLIHHLESRLQTRSPPRHIVPSFPHRNLSISAPLRAQYSRFDDHPNQDANRPPPPSFSALQRRDVIIYTIGIGSVVYYLFQCVHRLPL